jgi:hypothetical protein
MSTKRKNQRSKQGHDIQEVLKYLAARTGTFVPRRQLLADTKVDGSFVNVALRNLVATGVLDRQVQGLGPRQGKETRLGVRNQEALQAILDQKKGTAVYQKWVLDPPSRKVPLRKAAVTAAAPVSPAAVVKPAPTAARQVPTKSSDKLDRIAQAIKVLQEEGLL